MMRLATLPEDRSRINSIVTPPARASADKHDRFCRANPLRGARAAYRPGRPGAVGPLKQARIDADSHSCLSLPARIDRPAMDTRRTEFTERNQP
jgi:hypothetical protein